MPTKNTATRVADIECGVPFVYREPVDFELSGMDAGFDFLSEIEDCCDTSKVAVLFGNLRLPFAIPTHV